MVKLTYEFETEKEMQEFISATQRGSQAIGALYELDTALRAQIKHEIGLSLDVLDQLRLIRDSINSWDWQEE